jgi:hypothetical protein
MTTKHFRKPCPYCKRIVPLNDFALDFHAAGFCVDRRKRERSLSKLRPLTNCKDALLLSILITAIIWILIHLLG